MKKMRALAHIDRPERVGGLNDDPSPAYLVPGDRDAQPRIGASPAPESHKEIGAAFFHQFRVDSFQVGCNDIRILKIETVWPDVDHINQPCLETVAHGRTRGGENISAGDFSI